MDITQQEVSSQSITISRAKVEIDQSLVLGQDVTIELKGSVVQEILGDAQDGTITRTYVIRGAEARVK